MSIGSDPYKVSFSLDLIAPKLVDDKAYTDRMSRTIARNHQDSLMANIFNTAQVPVTFTACSFSVGGVAPGAIDPYGRAPTAQSKEFHCSQCGCNHGNKCEEIEDEDYYITNEYSCHSCGETWTETLFVDEEYCDDEQDS